MTTTDKKELVSKLKDEKKEIKELKDRLNSLNSKKEQLFDKKQNYDNEIRFLINNIRDFRKKRNNLTNQVKVLKEKRKKLNDEITSNIQKIKKLNVEKQEALKKHNVPEDPISIKSEIEKLEFKLETEAMSFGIEKRLMKKINVLKKSIAKFNEMSGTFKSITELSKLIDKQKEDAKNFHNEVQEKAFDSQILHESVIEMSNELTLLKTKDQDINEKFLNAKKEFTELNDQIKEKLPGIAEISGKLDKINEDKKKERRKKTEIILEEKEKKVEEKIKKRKKLTTEDLLVFQRKEMEKQS